MKTQDKRTTATATAEIFVVRPLRDGKKVVNLLGTGVVSDKPPPGSSSFIDHWRRWSGQRAVVCAARGCDRTDHLQGGHVKISNGPLRAALLHTRWYVLPVCPAHNRSSSCKTWRAKGGVRAVEAPPPSFGARVASWRADIAKAVRTLVAGNGGRGHGGGGAGGSGGVGGGRGKMRAAAAAAAASAAAGGQPRQRGGGGEEG